MATSPGDSERQRCFPRSVQIHAATESCRSLFTHLKYRFLSKATNMIARNTTSQRPVKARHFFLLNGTASEARWVHREGRYWFTDDGAMVLERTGRWGFIHRHGSWSVFNIFGTHHQPVMISRRHDVMPMLASLLNAGTGSSPTLRQDHPNGSPLARSINYLQYVSVHSILQRLNNVTVGSTSFSLLVM